MKYLYSNRISLNFVPKQRYNGCNYISVLGLKLMHVCKMGPRLFCLPNTFKSEQNGSHFADDIFWSIFLNKGKCLLIQISLKFVPKSLIDSKSTLVQVMAQHRQHSVTRTNDDPVFVRITHVTWALFQYLIRRLIVRSPDVSKLQDW